MSAAAEALSMIEQWKALAAKLEPALQERCVQEAVDGGAAVAVRPFSFRHPLKGETDPWFGLAYHQWLALRNEGFDGIFSPGDAGSGRAVLFIIYDRAAEFLRTRAAAQAGLFAERGEGTARLRTAKGKPGEAAA